jgi:uncharacterized cupin superfamily protein
MAFTIPDVASAWNAIQARVQSGDFQILADGAAGVGVLTGAAVSPQGSPNMTVAVASGTVRIGGSSVSVSSGNVTITANSSGSPRLDLICVDGSGTKTAQAGTAAATPRYPAIPGSSVVLAAVLVPTGASSITANNIVDKRVTVSTTTGLLAANNLSDVASATFARTNLGLGTMAVQSAAAVNVTGGAITGLSSPAASSDAATKGYVDALLGGTSATKLPVRAATTTNITLSGAQTIDGVSVVAGDRVLVKNQSTAANNGIYVAASGAWARAADADTSAEMFSGLLVEVSEGTTNGTQLYVLATANPITLGSTGLSFTTKTATIGTTSGTVAAGDDSRFTFSTSVLSTAYWKQPVRAATTANITLSGAQTIDGVSVIANDRVLVKNQSTGANNGIYVCASGSWTRAADADATAEMGAGTAVFVSEGTTNGDKLFTLTTNETITLGSTALTFTAVQGASSSGSPIDVLVIPTGTAATDVANINAALAVVAPASKTAAAGRVLLAPGYFSISAGFLVPHRVSVIGAGSSATWLFLTSAFPSSTAVFRNDNTNTSMRGEVNTFQGFSIDGTAASNSGLTGIKILHDWTEGDSGEQFVDQRGYITDIRIYNLNGDGIYTTGRSQGMCTDCSVFNIAGIGFYSEVDAFISTCDAGSCGKYGFWIAANTQVVNCKAWYCGFYNGSVVANLAAGEGCGYLFYEATFGNYTGVTATNLLAQDCARNGFRISNSGRMNLTGLQVDSCNNNAGGGADYAGIEIDNSYGVYLSNVFVWDRGANTTKMASGLSLINFSSYNLIEGTVAVDGTFLTKIFTSGSDQNNNGFLLNGHNISIASSVGATTYTPDLSVGTHRITLTGNATMGAPTNPYLGARLVFVFTQDGTGGRTVTWNATYKRAGGSLTVTSTAAAISRVEFEYSGSAWLEVARSLALA